MRKGRKLNFEHVEFAMLLRFAGESPETVTIFGIKLHYSAELLFDCECWPVKIGRITTPT